MVYNTTTFELVSSKESKLPTSCINTVAFHPYSAIIISSTGQRQFSYPGDDTLTDSDEESNSIVNNRTFNEQITNMDLETIESQNEVVGNDNGNSSNIENLTRRYKPPKLRSEFQVWSVSRTPIVVIPPISIQNHELEAINLAL